MFALEFRFPAGRYHATPWERNVNEAAVEWPPEPWRLLRALIAAYWRKGDRVRWSEDELARLIEALAGELPWYRLPEGAIHAHTRHYMPTGRLSSAKVPVRTLVFDAFVRLPEKATVVAAWPGVTLDAGLFELAADLASAIGYLGRAESWADCVALDAWADLDSANCRPAREARRRNPVVRVLAPRTAPDYAKERQALRAAIADQVREGAVRKMSSGQVRKKVSRRLFGKVSRRDTLPPRLLDALTLETADYREAGWNHPPASRQVSYSLDPRALPGVAPRLRPRPRRLRTRPHPTVARFLLAGRPQPRVEDTVKIGELMRLAALARFGWETDPAIGRRRPMAPATISGRGKDGKHLRNSEHSHTFWLPEDADGDGWLDHISLFCRNGFDADVRSKLDRIRKLWIGAKGGGRGTRGRKEWRLALEGFGQVRDFAVGSRIFGSSRAWISATPFLAAGHLNSGGYPREVRRLLKRRGFVSDSAAPQVQVEPLSTLRIAGRPRSTMHFHRFRSRRRERQFDARGAFLRLRFPKRQCGPLALGYASHFGLGLFVRDDAPSDAALPAR